MYTMSAVSQITSPVMVEGGTVTQGVREMEEIEKLDGVGPSDNRPSTRYNGSVNYRESWDHNCNQKIVRG